MFYIDKLMNLALHHPNKLLFLATAILTIITGSDIPPEDVSS